MPQTIDAQRPAAKTHRRTSEAGSCRGLVERDGRISDLGDGLLDRLGFASGDDLRGLRFESLWAHVDRPIVQRGLRRAAAGANTVLSLDLNYLTGEDRSFTLTLRPTRDQSALRVELGTH
ncbi:MAG: PAS domain-containing protein [Pseudomonadota bacterium]